MRREDGFGLPLRVVEKSTHLIIDRSRRPIRVGLLGTQGLAEESLLSVVQPHEAQSVGHAKLRDHLPGDPGCLLQVVGCPRCGIAENQLLRGATPGEHGHLIPQLAAVHQASLFGRQRLGISEGLAARDDRNLVKRVCSREGPSDKGVAGLVISDDLALGWSQH